MLRGLRLRHLWLLIPFWIAAWRAGRELGDNSFLWHVRAGLDQLAIGEVIRSDPYSFTHGGEPWRTQSWLIELAYGRLETWFGDLAWVNWFLFLVVAGVLVVVLAGMVRSGTAIAGIAVVFAVLAWIFQPYMSPRPVVVSYVLFAVTGVIVASRRPALWAVPGVMWLWASLHGSFVVGLGILVLDALRRRTRTAWLAVGAGVAAVSATAHGAAVWEIIYRFAFNREGLERIQEWQPPDFTNLALVAVLPLLGLLMVGLATQRISTDALWIVIPMVAFALLSTRNVLPALLVIAPWLAAAGGALPDWGESDLSPPLVWATAGGVVVTALILVASPVVLDADRFPNRALFAELGDDRTFHSIGPGGALIYFEGPDRKVFVDDRVELYGPDFLGEYYAAIDGIEWRGLFVAEGVEQALLHDEDVLVPRLEEDGWQTCVDDGGFRIMRPVCDT